MRNNINFLLLGVCLTLLTSCMPRTGLAKYQNKIYSLLQVRISEGEEIISYDSHGGFHNDGTTCFGVKLDDDKVLNQIKENNLWHVGPFPSFLNTALYGKYDKETLVKSPLITKSNDDKPLVPLIKDGYYAFIDLYGNIDLEKDECYSVYNFTIGLYDLENNSFYFCEKDT